MTDSKNEAVRPRTVIWKGEVEFRGTPEEFKSFSETLVAAGVSFDIKDAMIASKRQYGYVAPVFLGIPRSVDRLNESNSLRIGGAVMKDINGGIRTPHMHLGGEIVLVDRDHFKTLLGEVARDVFEQRALEKDDFYEVIAPLVTAAG
jgi:hypothetical protein